jgi:hypothetical protein
MAIIISSDDIKKKLPNYSPNKAEDFHRESTRQADKTFTKTLKESIFQEVILLSGGAASGKTEFLSTHLHHNDYIVLDSTLDTEERAKIKLKQILKANKVPIIFAVIPDDLRRAFAAFLNRDRKFSDEHFYRTHTGSRKVLLWIASNYHNVEINIIESSYSLDGKLQFLQIQFDNKQKLLNYLIDKQLTENDIINIIKA